MSLKCILSTLEEPSNLIFLKERAIIQIMDEP
jgi:hypothetical protein